HVRVWLDVVCFHLLHVRAIPLHLLKLPLASRLLHLFQTPSNAVRLCRTSTPAPSPPALRSRLPRPRRDEKVGLHPLTRGTRRREVCDRRRAGRVHHHRRARPERLRRIEYEEHAPLGRGGM
ncbi:hypothetical protein B0H14DRAFT_2963207, partial [Mycena olivaceomarginata]